MPSGKPDQRQSGGWEWIASYMIGGVLLGGLIGAGCDWLLGTLPLFMIAGVFAGFALALYGIYKKA